VSARRADVAVVGLGAAGGIAALRFALAGLHVIGLEAGARVGRENAAFDELANDFENRLGPKANSEVPTWRPQPSGEATTGREGRMVRLMANGVGGGTIHYAGQHFRLAPWHFRLRSSALPSTLPPACTATDWPIGYDDLEPYYALVEDELGISGAGGVNPFEGQRSGDYPLPPLRRTGWTELVAAAARRLGLHPYPGPAAMLSEPYRGRPACTYCGFCNWNGCHVDAKSSTHLTAIPRAETTGNLDLVTGARVTEILVDRDGLASGVRFVRDGREEMVHVRFVFLSAHSLENVRLLLLSPSRAHPNGLANNRLQVGRNAMSHLYVGVDGVFPGRRLNRFGGTWPQCTSLDDYNAANFDASGLGFVGGGCISAIQEAKPIATALSTPPSAPRWGAAWKEWLAAHGNSVGRLVAAAESLPYEDAFLDLDPSVTDPFGTPVVRITYRLHEQELRRYDFLHARMAALLLEAGASETWTSFPKLPAAPFQSLFGATRMGDDPDASVVDGWCIAHDVPNLAIVGSSSFPTSGGYGPTATIQALAWRTANYAAARIRRS
jgi:gluconate 2-dehydrogenase alpha chain